MSSLSTSSLVHRHDGHIDGYLNCTAIRHGWTRAFSISPAEVNALDYDALARILELATLKLRSVNLRIYVENPPDSGTFSKVRVWKDDGSLQSVLVKQFFEDRMRDGLLMRFEIRDGRERKSDVWGDLADDSVAGTSEGHDALFNRLAQKGKKRSAISLDWFTRSRAALHDNGGPSTPNKTRSWRFLDLFIFGRTTAEQHARRFEHDDDTPLRRAVSEDHNADALNEDAARPSVDSERTPLIRKPRSSLRTKLANASHRGSPFFASAGPRRTSRTAPTVHFSSVVKGSTPAPPLAMGTQHHEVPEVSVFEMDSNADEDASGKEAPPGLIAAFWRSFFGLPPRDRESHHPAVVAEVQQKQQQKLKRPSRPIPPTKLSSRAQRKKGERDVAATQHFKGAHVVRRPEDAFPPRADSAVSGLFDVDPSEDPFRG